MHLDVTPHVESEAETERLFFSTGVAEAAPGGLLITA